MSLLDLSGDEISAQIGRRRGGAGCGPGIGFQGVFIRIEWEHMFPSKIMGR